MTDMDPMKYQFLMSILPMVAVVASVAVVGWVVTTWLRIKHGYPLDGAWGQAIYPKKNEEAMERIRLLSSENAQLRAELGSIKDRLATVERIVTDDSHRLTQDIEALRMPRN
jgi:predicted metal-binding membrane protein